MRTTLTLDDDVASKVRAEARRTGWPFKRVVNEALRASLLRGARKTSSPFRVKPRDLGVLKPGVSVDNIAELLERLDGPSHR